MKDGLRLMFRKISTASWQLKFPKHDETTQYQFGSAFATMLHIMNVSGPGPTRWVLKSRSERTLGRKMGVVTPRRASDDDEIVPILSGRRKTGFTEKEYEQLRNPRLLGKNTRYVAWPRDSGWRCLSDPFLLRFPHSLTDIGSS